MDFEYSAKVKELEQRVRAFMDLHVYPNEANIQAEINKDRWPARYGRGGGILAGTRPPHGALEPSRTRWR